MQRYEYKARTSQQGHVTDNMNEMAKDGWEFMNACSNEGTSTLTLFFRRERQEYVDLQYARRSSR